MLQEQNETPDEDAPPGEAQDTTASESDTIIDGTAAIDETAVPETIDAPASADGASVSETLFSVEALRGKGEALLAWLQSQMFTLDLALQAAILVAALIPAAAFGPHLKRFVTNQIAPRAPYGFLRRAASAFAHLATPIALYLFLQAAVIALGSFGVSNAIVGAGVSLLMAWIVIRLVTLVIRSPFWSKVAFYVVWPIAALDAFGVLGDVVAQLEAFSFPIGEDQNGNPQRFSALDFLRTAAIFGVLFWAANFAGGFVKGRIDTIDELTISFKALLGKILDVLLPIVALVAALQLVGFPFGALAIFGGAIGLGVGLGMQGTVSNFFAGFTLIADKSIKPGDVIEIDGTYGWVTQMNARYVSLRTRDGKAYLVPNDKFIEDGVINWSHSDRVLRLHAKFGVAYGTKDLRFVKKLCEETALTIDRVLENPAPRCNLMEFGDSAINFDLRFWINDPANGTSNIRSEVLLAIWDKFHEHNIEIPFPQRDLHIKSLPEGAGLALDSRPQAVESKA